MIRTILLALLAALGGLLCYQAFVLASPAAPEVATGWLDATIAWISTYWWAVTIALVVLGSVLNSITNHYGSKHPWLVPLIGVILEAISVLTSKDSRAAGSGWLKFPLQNVPPSEEGAPSEKSRLGGGMGGPLSLVVLLILPIVGCGTCDLVKSIDKTHMAVRAARQSAKVVLDERCSKIAKDSCAKSPKGVPPPECPELASCQKLRRQIYSQCSRIQTSLNTALAFEGADDAKAKEIFKRSMAAFQELVQLLTKHKILLEGVQL